MKSGENIKIVTRAVKNCLENRLPVVIETKNRENAQNLADLIEWLGYGKMVFTQIRKDRNW